MEQPEVDKGCAAEDAGLSRNRSFKSKQLVRSQAIRESASPPRTGSPYVAVGDVTRDQCDTTAPHRDDKSPGDRCERQQPVEIQITSGGWEVDAQSEQRLRTRRWLGQRPHSDSSRDLLSYNARVACVCGACACPHCRGRRRQHACSTKQDSGIACSDDCPDCADAEHAGPNGDGSGKSGSFDAEEQIPYCRCPEKKETPMTISLGGIDQEEPTGPELVSFLRDTLNKNPRDRSTLLRIERELHSLVTDNGRCIVRFPVMTSYGRMLVHRCAALFQLCHHLDQTNKNSVLVSKSGTSGGRIPCTSFREWCTANFPRSPPRRHEDTLAKSILKRCDGGLGSVPAVSGGRSKSLEQREREYERVRRRIFSTDNCTQDESQWPWLASGPVKLLTPDTGRNKLLKVQSLESRGGSESGVRGPVSKSHSFGGYTAEPPQQRMLSKQGDQALSSWRLSPSSSGYKTLSLRSTDSVTPSPSPTGGTSPEPGIEATTLVWAVTNMSAVPAGAVVIHPQTGRPLTNPDGTIYHFDPKNPPILYNTRSYTRDNDDDEIEQKNETRRGKFEKQHSFVDNNECECQPEEECLSKCCCEFRHGCGQKTASEKGSPKKLNSTSNASTPTKTRREPTKPTATEPKPDTPDNRNTTEPISQPTTNQVETSRQTQIIDPETPSTECQTNVDAAPPISANQTPPNTRSSGSANQTPPYTRSSGSANQTPPNTRPSESANQTPPNTRSSEFANQTPPNTRSSEFANQTPPNIRSSEFANQTPPNTRSSESSNQRPAYEQRVYEPTNRIQRTYDNRPDTINRYDQNQRMPAKVPDDVFQQNMYLQGFGNEEMVSPHSVITYQQQNVDMQSVMQAKGTPVPVPDPNIRPVSLTNVMYSTSIPPPNAYSYLNACRIDPAMQAAPMYQPMVQPLEEHIKQLPTSPHNDNTFRIDPSYPYAADFSAACGVCEPVPVQQPRGYNVPYGQVEVPPGMMQPYAVPNVLIQPPMQPYPYQEQVPIQWQGIQQPAISSPAAPKVMMHDLYPMVYPNVYHQPYNIVYPQVVPAQYPLVQPVYPVMDNEHDSRRHSVTRQRRDAITPGRDDNDIAMKIQQIKDQMAQLNTKERGRNEWRRRNSGSGILGNYPVNFNGRVVGSPHEEAQLSSAARAIVNSIRNIHQNKTNNYQHENRRFEPRGDRPEFRGRGFRPFDHRDGAPDREERRDRRPQPPPLYRPPYLFRQMSPGAWCRRSPGPVPPAFNQPRRPYPDSRNGRRQT